MPADTTEGEPLSKRAARIKWAAAAAAANSALECEKGGDGDKAIQVDGSCINLFIWWPARLANILPRLRMRQRGDIKFGGRSLRREGRGDTYMASGLTKCHHPQARIYHQTRTVTLCPGICPGLPATLDATRR